MDKITHLTHEQALNLVHMLRKEIVKTTKENLELWEKYDKIRDENDKLKEECESIRLLLDLDNRL